MDEIIGRFIAINLMTCQVMLREARRYKNPEAFLRSEFDALAKAIEAAPIQIEGVDGGQCRAIALTHLDEARQACLLALKSQPKAE